MISFFTCPIVDSVGYDCMLLSCHVRVLEWISRNIKDLYTRNRGVIWSLNETNRIQTHNHLVRKGTLNHLA